MNFKAAAEGKQPKIIAYNPWHTWEFKSMASKIKVQAFSSHLPLIGADPSNAAIERNFPRVSVGPQDALVLSLLCIDKKTYEGLSISEARLEQPLLPDSQKDMQYVGFSILVAKELQDVAEKAGVKPPVIFLLRDGAVNEETAQIISEHTGQTVHFFNGSVEGLKISAETVLDDMFAYSTPIRSLSMQGLLSFSEEDVSPSATGRDNTL